jgi:superfamily II DNA or RNA helicase
MRITAGNSLLLISPWLKSLQGLLTLHRRVRGEDGRYTAVPEKMYCLEEINGITSGYAPAGLADRIFDFLNRNNISYTFVDNRPPVPMPDFSLIDVHSLRDGQDTALVRIGESQCGILTAATGYGKSYIIVQIAKMYPDQNIVITTARKQVVSTLYDRLMAEQSLAGQVGIICSDKNTGPNFRIVVSTIRSLHKTNIAKCDMLIADECHNFGAAGAAEEVAKFIRARKYGFSASPTGRADNADLATEAIFGPVLFDFSYEESVGAGAVVPIEVHVYNITKGNSKDYKDPASVNRHGMWRNPWRNEMICKVARMHSDKQVLILCDTVDHVMHLKRLLPEAVIAYSHCSKERYESDYVAKGFTDDPYLKKKDIDKIRIGLEDGSIKLCISTMIFKEGVNFTHLGCLIRGDGASGEIPSTQIPGRLSRTCDGKDKGILIDFMDLFDRRLKNRSVKRITSYKKKGWVVKYNDKF